jgi:serine/threonine protein phosphatase PrpC
VINSEDTDDCTMLILACDGVWDVFSDQEAADFLMEAYIAHERQPFEDAAKISEGCPILEHESGTVEVREIGTMVAM